MTHIEEYIQVLKKMDPQRGSPPRAAVPSITFDLPGLKSKAAPTPEELQGVRSEYKRVLEFYRTETIKHKKARGDAKKALAASRSGARARLKELSFILGDMTPRERSLFSPEGMLDGE